MTYYIIYCAFFIVSACVAAESNRTLACPYIGNYVPFEVSTGDLVVIPTKVPNGANLSNAASETTGYSCITLKEAGAGQSLFIYNSNRDVTLSSDQVTEYLTNDKEVQVADTVYIDIMSDKPVVLSNNIKAYNKIKELRIRCATSLTLSHVKIENIERLIIENVETKGTYTALAGTIESDGDLVIIADNFLCSATVLLGGDFIVTAHRSPLFKSSKAQVIKVNTFTVKACNNEPITFVPKLGLDTLTDYQTVQTSHSLVLETDGEVKIFGWDMNAGGDLIIAGNKQNSSDRRTDLISIDLCEFKAGASIICRADIAEMYSSSLMAHNALDLNIRRQLATRATVLFSNESLSISTKDYKDELSLLKSCASIQLTIADALALHGSRVLTPHDIVITDGDRGTSDISISRQATKKGNGETSAEIVYEGELRSLYGSINIKGLERVHINGMIMRAGKNISIDAREGNLVIETTRDGHGALLGGLEAGADNTVFFKEWFKEVIKDNDIHEGDPSSVYMHGGGLLHNQLHVRAPGSIELTAGEAILNKGLIEAGKKMLLSAPRIENSIDEKQKLLGTLFAPDVVLTTNSLGRVINTGRIGAGGEVIIDGERFVNRGILDAHTVKYALTDAFVADGFITLNKEISGDASRLVVRGIIKNPDSLNLRARESILLAENGLLVTPFVTLDAPRVVVDGMIRQGLSLTDREKNDPSWWSNLSVQAEHCTFSKDLLVDTLYVKAEHDVKVAQTLMARDGTVEVPRGTIEVLSGARVIFKTSSLVNDKHCPIGLQAKALINHGHILLEDLWCPDVTQSLSNHHQLESTASFDVDQQTMIFNNTGTVTSPLIKAYVNALIGGGTVNSTITNGLGLDVKTKNDVRLEKVIAGANAYVASQAGRIELNNADITGNLACRGAPEGLYLSGTSNVGSMRLATGAIEGSITIDGSLTLNEKLNAHPSAIECNGSVRLSDKGSINIHGAMSVKAHQDIELSGDMVHSGNESLYLYLLTPGVITLTRRVVDDLPPKIQSQGLVVLNATSINGHVHLRAHDGVIQGIDAIKLEGFIATTDTLKALSQGLFDVESIEIGGDGYIEARGVTIRAKEHVCGNYNVITNEYNNPVDHAVAGTFALFDPHVNGTLYKHLIEPEKGLVFDNKLIHTAPQDSIVFYGDHAVINNDMNIHNWQSETYGKGFECHHGLVKSANGFDHQGGHILIGCALETPRIIKLGGEKLLVTQEFEWGYDVNECQKRGLPCCHVSPYEPLDADRCPAGDSLNVRPLWNDRPKWTERGAMQIRRALDNSGILKADTLLVGDIAQDVTLEGATIDVRQLNIAGKNGMKLLPVLVLARAFHKERSSCKKGRCVTRDFYTAYSVTSIVPSKIRVKDNCTLVLQDGNFELIDSDFTVNGPLDMDVQNGDLQVKDQTYPSSYGWRCADRAHCTDGICADGKHYCEEGTFVEMHNKKQSMNALLTVGGNASIWLSENFIVWGGSAEFFANLNLTVAQNLSIKPLALHNNLGVGGHQGAGGQFIAADATLSSQPTNAVSQQIHYEGPGQGIDFLGGSIRIHGNGDIDVWGNMEVPGGIFAVGKNSSLEVGGRTSVSAIAQTYLASYESWRRGHAWNTAASVKQGGIVAGQNMNVNFAGGLDVEGGAIIAGEKLRGTIGGEWSKLVPLSIMLEAHREQTKRKLFSKSKEIMHLKQELLIPFMVAGKDGTHLLSKDGTILIGFGELGSNKTTTRVKGKHIEILPTSQHSEMFYERQVKGFGLFGLGGVLERGNVLRNMIDALPVVKEVKMLSNSRSGEKTGAVLAAVDAATHLWSNPSSIITDAVNVGIGYFKTTVKDIVHKQEPRFPVLRGNVLIEADTLTYGGAEFEGGDKRVQIRASKIHLKPVEKFTRHYHEESYARHGVSAGLAGPDCTRASHMVRQFGYAIERSAPIIFSRQGVVMAAESMTGPLLVATDKAKIFVDKVTWEPAISEFAQKTVITGNSFGLGLKKGLHGELNKQEIYEEKTMVDGGGVYAEEFLGKGQEWHLKGTTLAAQGQLNVTHLFNEDLEEFERIAQENRSIRASISPSFTWHNIKDILATGALTFGKRLEEIVVKVLTTISPEINIHEKETNTAPFINRDLDQSKHVLRHTRNGVLYYVPLASPASLEARVNGIRQTNKNIAQRLRDWFGVNKKGLPPDCSVNTIRINEVEAVIDEYAHVFTQEEVEDLYESAQSRLKNGQENVVKQKEGIWIVNLDDRPNEKILTGDTPVVSNGILTQPHIQTIEESAKVLESKYMITFKSTYTPEQIMKYIAQSYFTPKFEKMGNQIFSFFTFFTPSYFLKFHDWVAKYYDFDVPVKVPFIVDSRIDIDGLLNGAPHIAVAGVTSTSITFATSNEPLGLGGLWWTRETPKSGLITFSVDRVDDKITFVIHTTLKMHNKLFGATNSKGSSLGEEIQKPALTNFCRNVMALFQDEQVLID